MAVKSRRCWCCNGCGHQEPHWRGQCPQCRQWNTFEESVTTTTPPRRFDAASTAAAASLPVRLRDIGEATIPRIPTHFGEVDRILGGGLVPGALTLVGGDPGIGKSTLMLQLSHSLASHGLLVLYVCGEESVEQTSLRARRLGVDSDNLFLLNETEFSAILAHVDALKPHVLIIDSIQIVYKGELPAAPGSVVQVRETAAECMHLAKKRRISIFLVGHVTKAGEIAGPRVLEHLVDTVLYFEGDKQHNYRMVRAVKNRFGPTDEVAVFQMQERGLVEIPNPSQLFLADRSKGTSGTVVIPALEGTRALLVEAQALVTETVFSTPSRRCTGIDQNRLALLVAVLEKRLRCQLFRCDIFVALTGGLRLVEPALDLGLLVAITSSLRNRQVAADTAIIGEVGLGGEVRAVVRVESRIKECLHMGFRRVIFPRRNGNISSTLQDSIACVPVDTVDEAVTATLPHSHS